MKQANKINRVIDFVLNSLGIISYYKLSIIFFFFFCLIIWLVCLKKKKKKKPLPYPNKGEVYSL